MNPWNGLSFFLLKKYRKQDSFQLTVFVKIQKKNCWTFVVKSRKQDSMDFKHCWEIHKKKTKVNVCCENPGNKTPWTCHKLPKILDQIQVFIFLKKTLWTIVKIQKTKLLRLLKVKNKTQRHFYLISTMTVNYKKKLTL